MPTSSYSYTGGYQTFVVPAGITSVSVDVRGAGSGSNAGGRVTGTLAVTGGQVLYLVCGQAGQLASGANGGGNAWGGGGAGGDAKSGSGGDGGGGYSAIRIGSTSGTVKVVAGGAGGSSGDNGAGGEGGSTTGGSGSRGTSGSNSTGNATGGTQSQGGNKGTSSSGSEFDGDNAADTVLNAYGGAGGGPSPYHSHGGGGGGGGYHQGGGGQASSVGFAPGGGGGGGSNYTGGLSGASSARGLGGTGGGDIILTYATPPPANAAPNTPTTAKVNGVNETPDFASKSTGSVTVSAVISDPDADDVRLLVRTSLSSIFLTYIDTYSGYVGTGHTASAVVTGLAQNQHYFVRLYTQDEHGKYSVGYNVLDFWTNRKPVATPVDPAENITVPGIASLVFNWTYADPDTPDPQTGFEIQYRTAATLTSPAGPWVTVSQPSVPFQTWTFDPGTFKGTTYYEYQIRVKDSQGLWGDFSIPQSFFVSSISAPPVLLFPISDQAIDANVANTFTWRFVDPDPGDAQTKADIRYRLVGADDSSWVMLLGDVVEPGADPEWMLGPDTFVIGYHYEWQARTYDTIGGSQSDWSRAGTFWTTGTPGQAVTGQPVAASTLVKGSLGCGAYEVYVYFQGGMQLVGQIDPLSALQFNRTRDGISAALITSNGFGVDCGPFYGNLHCWLHEIVIFRDGERVWEGPITRIAYQGINVEIEAQDVMVYAYRRIMRQGYNDSYQLLNGQNLGNPSVVERAEAILVNALAPYDPNILPYLTAIQFDDDASESRVVPDYAKTAWEEVDDLAATAGLDYTTIGRRIILWDTHRPIGRVPEMRDGDFSDDPIITEYGMSLANYFAVTNGSGVWGAVSPNFTDPPELQVINGGFNHILHPHGTTTPTEHPWWQVYGPIEMLASAYGEAAGGTDEALTPASKAALVASMVSQAQRNIGGRWPTPVVVRVPDNSALNPECNVTFDQLVPGVWIPLRSEQFTRTVVQWQKLDSMSVTVDAEGGEKITVVMSPAPDGGQDPDLDAQIAEDSS